jgi:hypothetical protein
MCEIDVADAPVLLLVLDEPQAAATSATTITPMAAKKLRLTFRMFSILRY